MRGYVVWKWQFIEQRFVPGLETYAGESEAWAYVHEQVAAGKDRSRFYVARRGAA